MNYPSFLTLLAATSTVLANTEQLVLNGGLGGKNVVYWGVGDNNQRNLADYCNDNEAIDILVLSFLDTYGNGQSPSGQIGPCTIDLSGNGDGCDQLAADITTCQSEGVQIFISIGGGGASGYPASQADAEGIAWTLWNSYASPSAITGLAPRPFGDSFVNGWDLDVESNPNGDNQYYQYLVNALRSYFSNDTVNSYAISAAPQCYMQDGQPDANMGDTITNSVFDYVWVQFYNNRGCAPFTDEPGGSFNFDQIYQWMQTGASASAALLIGLSAAPGASGYSQDFLAPNDLLTLLQEYSSHPGFGGVMMWDAEFSDSMENTYGCSYAAEIGSILRNGYTCS